MIQKSNYHTNDIKNLKKNILKKYKKLKKSDKNETDERENSN